VATCTVEASRDSKKDCRSCQRRALIGRRKRIRAWQMGRAPCSFPRHSCGIPDRGSRQNTGNDIGQLYSDANYNERAYWYGADIAGNGRHSLVLCIGAPGLLERTAPKAGHISSLSARKRVDGNATKHRRVGVRGSQERSELVTTIRALLGARRRSSRCLLLAARSSCRYSQILERRGSQASATSNTSRRYAHTRLRRSLNPVPYFSCLLVW